MTIKTPLVNLKYILLLLASIAIYFNFTSVITLPSVWPDEALIADSALNAVNKHTLGTNLLTGTLPGVEKYGFSYPPLFYLTLAVWIKITGFSIITLRWLSCLIAMFFIAIFTWCCLQLFKESNQNKSVSNLKFVPYIITLALLLDLGFTKASHIVRPEIEVLLFGFLAIFFNQKKSSNPKKQLFYTILSGLCASFAFLTHYIGIIFIAGIFMSYVLENPKAFFKNKYLFLTLLAFVLPVIIWVVASYPYINYIFKDISLRLIYKTRSPYWVWLIFSSPSLSLKAIYLLYFVVLWEALLTLYLAKDKKYLFAPCLLLFAWIFYYIWQSEYPFIYVIVMTYLNLLFFILHPPATGLNKATRYWIMLILLMVLNFSQDLKQSNLNQDYHYVAYIDQITDLIPPEASVYLSASPDPYFALQPTHTTLYEFPNLPTDKENLVQILNQSDYIVINQAFERIVVGDVTIPYIETNAESIKTIGEATGYSATVVKLKPRNARNHPTLN